MPYRRLPNTDAARIKALRTALSLGKEIPPFKLAFTQRSLSKLQSFISYFEQALSNQRQTYEIQVRNNISYKESFKKIKLYLSHFIQVMNMAIVRGELSEDTRGFFGLNNDLRSVPSLNTEKEILEIGANVIKGESERLRMAKTAITNPTMAVVKVRYEQYLDAYNFQKTLQKRNKLALEKLASLRSDADDIILEIWNEVEDHFKDLPENMKREEAAKYGLVYVFRKNELLRIHFSQSESDQSGIGETIN